jgi:hypothetical protein
MGSVDIWRVKEGKPMERRDELNLLEVFQQICTGRVKKAEGQ